jgi:methylmalonyl-CoA mutase N-terminal domain/subunit
VVVGVNEFVTDDPPASGDFRVDPAVAAVLSGRLAAFRAARDGDRARGALDRLEAGARGQDNLVPLILDAVKASVTLGEICDRLRGVFGVYRPAAVL